MATTYDSDLEAVAADASSLTISGLVIANNANRYLIISVAAWDAVAGDTVVSGITWNGSAFGASIANKLMSAANNRITLWGGIAPTATTANVVVTMVGACEELGANVTSFYNVHQTTPLGTAVTAEGTTGNATVTVTAAVDDLVYDGLYHYQQTSPNPTTAQTQLARSQIVAGGGWILASSAAGAASVAMLWTLAGTDTREWVCYAVAIKQAASGTTVTPGNILALLNSQANILQKYHSVSHSSLSTASQSSKLQFRNITSQSSVLLTSNNPYSNRGFITGQQSLNLNSQDSKLSRQHITGQSILEFLAQNPLLGFVFTPSNTSMSLTLQDSTLGLAYIINQLDLNLQSQDSNLYRVLLSGQASLSLTSNNPTLYIGSIISPLHSSLGLTSNAFNLYFQLNVDQSTLNLSGQDLKLNFRHNPGHSNLNFTNQNSNLGLSFIAGQLSLNLNSSGSNLYQSLLTGQASLELFSNIPTLYIGSVISPLHTSLELFVSDSSLGLQFITSQSILNLNRQDSRLNFSTSVPHNQLLFNSSAPIQRLQITPETISLITNLQNSNLGIRLDIPVADLLLTLQATNLLQDYMVVPGNITVILESQIPVATYPYATIVTPDTLRFLLGLLGITLFSGNDLITTSGRYGINPVENWVDGMTKSNRYGANPVETWVDIMTKSGRYGND